MSREFEEGDLVKLREHHLVYQENVKQLINNKFRVIKYTKGGLVNIHVDGDVRKRISVAQDYLVHTY